MERYILDDINLNEISAVDDPAQPTAKATIFKRSGQISLQKAIAKAYYEPNGDIKDFSLQLQINEDQKKLWQARDKLYPLFDALNSTIGNIVADSFLSVDQKKERIEQNSKSFADAVMSEIPDISIDLVKFFIDAGTSGENTNPEEESMTPEEIEKKVSEAVTAKETELTKAFDEKLDEAVKLAFETMFAFDGDELELFKAKSKEDQDELMKLTPEERKKKLKDEKATDEVVKFEGKEIAKSAVGDATFALYKRLEAMDVEVAKAKEAEEFAKLEKRASEEFANLPGTDFEKASILKAVNSLDAEVKKNLEAILKAANEGHKEAFLKKGSDKAIDLDDIAVKKAALDSKVSEIMKARDVTKTKAFEIVAVENPELI